MATSKNDKIKIYDAEQFRKDLHRACKNIDDVSLAECKKARVQRHHEELARKVKAETFEAETRRTADKWHEAFVKLGLDDETLAKIGSCAIVIAMAVSVAFYNPVI